MGKWLKEAVVYVIRNQTTLSRVPVTIFTTGYSFRDRLAENIFSAEIGLRIVRAHVKPVEAAYFPGNGYPDIISLANRAVAKLAWVVPGDYRDITSMKKWGHRLMSLWRPTMH